MSKKSIFVVAGLAVVGLAAGIAVNQYLGGNDLSLGIPGLSDKPETQEVARTGNSDIAPAFTLTDMEGKTRNSSEWDGKVRLVNFWASWCPPCVREIPAFIELQEKYAGKDKNFTLIGIALDEKQAVIDFVDPMGINYPIMIAEQEGIALTKAYGNRLGVLPFTVLVDSKGKMIKSFMRELSLEEAEQVIKPYLNKK